MNEKALKIYQSTFLVELTKDNSIEKTYGFIVMKAQNRNQN